MTNASEGSELSELSELSEETSLAESMVSVVLAASRAVSAPVKRWPTERTNGAVNDGEGLDLNARTRLTVLEMSSPDCTCKGARGSCNADNRRVRQAQIADA